jgi:hypothetical protein
MATICRNCLRALSRPSTRGTISSTLPLATYRTFSVLNRPPPNYEGHVPLTTVERAGLAVGSALWSFFDPTRPGISYLVSVSSSVSNNCYLRPHRGPRRSNSPTLLHNPSSRRHALQPHRPSYPPRPAANHIQIHEPRLSTKLA